MKKSDRFFFISILLLFIILAILEWMQDKYFGGSITSPLIKVQTLTVIVMGTIIMKLTLSDNFFKIFLISYGALWLIYFFMAKALKYFISPSEISVIVVKYLSFTKIVTPLPFILFWFLNKISVLTEGKSEKGE